MSDFSNPGSAPGLEIWRIEKLRAVPLPKADYGKFYVGDSYIVLKTTQPNLALAWDVFFWLGSESTTDELGIAAYKTVELDDLLGGAPVQHREVQGKESEEFLQCFKKIEYKKGVRLAAAPGFSQSARRRTAAAALSQPPRLGLRARTYHGPFPYQVS